MIDDDGIGLVWYTNDHYVTFIPMNEFEGEFSINIYSDSIELLHRAGVLLEKGLSSDELNRIKHVYGIEFPKSLKEFLLCALPISIGFYNWRDFSDSNINRIKKIMEDPRKELYEELYEEPCDIDWCDKWGEAPGNKSEYLEKVSERINEAPALIPIYGHRYMPLVNHDNPPVLSVHGSDIIYYGENLKEYFKVEFKKKLQNSMDFKNIQYIPFWSDLL